MEDSRAGGLEGGTKGSAKVQIGAELLCKGGAPESQGASWHVGQWTREARAGGLEAH